MGSDRKSRISWINRFSHSIFFSFFQMYELMHPGRKGYSNLRKIDAFKEGLCYAEQQGMLKMSPQIHAFMEDLFLEVMDEEVS